ncbi:MAG: hypothetical protein MMC23_008984 [Stictis urceolatum]|nr:hypothetical protein [Stictis urceolata]
MVHVQSLVLLGTLASWAGVAGALDRGEGIRSIPLRTHSLTAIEFEFKIHGKANLHGDGMALWVTRQRAQQGQVFGHADKFEGLGIFFDTYKNNRPGTVFPYVMAMVGDGQISYDKDSDGKDQELAGCSARGIRGATVPTKARLTYFQDKSLQLDLRYKSEDEWTTCFETGSVTLPSVAYLGFSGETGELSDNFDVVSVETKNLYQVNPSSGSGSSGKSNSYTRKDGKKTSDGSGRWVWFLIKVLLVTGACGGAYVGWTAYRTSKRHSRFD